MRTLSIVAWLAALGVVGPALSHHSDSGYDQDSVLGFAATVSRFVWRNPHITIFVDTVDEAGERVEWELEAGSTPIMSRSGWTRDMLAPGDEITVRAHPDRGQRSRAMILSIETADGSVWAQDERDYGATASATSLEGVWKGIGATIGPFNEQVAATALTEAGAAAQARYDFRIHSPVVDCIPPPAPAITGSTVYLNEVEFLEDRVILRSEFFDVERTVHMDGRGHPEDGQRTNQGHSIGRWEDDVLVVDSTLFADHPSANGMGVPSGAGKHLIERFSLSEDGTRMIVDIFLEDPEFLAEPITGRKELLYTPHFELQRYDCDPELSRQSGFE